MAGPNRHVSMDTQGLPLAIQRQAASEQGSTRAGAILAEANVRAPDLRLVWGDGRYGGPLVG